MNKLPRIALVLTALIGATASGHAQDASSTTAATPPTQNKLKGFEKEFDADHDGKLNETEKEAMIAKYDKNGNGKIDKDELPPKKSKQGSHPKNPETTAPAQ
jgi:Ca2+-binding EF-hand superfamily protein